MGAWRTPLILMSELSANNNLNKRMVAVLIEQLESQLAEAEKESIRCHETIGLMSEELAKKDKRIRELEERNEKQKNIIGSMRENIKLQEQEIGTLDNIIQGLREKIYIIKNTLEKEFDVNGTVYVSYVIDALKQALGEKK